MTVARYIKGGRTTVPGGVVLLDDVDAYLLDERAWKIARDGYVHCRYTVSRGRRKWRFIHRVILGLADGDPLQVDHINRNKRDNRRENLRIVTAAVNSQNRLRVHEKSSRYANVCWNRGCRKWQASVKVGGRNHHLGLFDDELEAALTALRWRDERGIPAPGWELLEVVA